MTPSLEHGPALSISRRVRNLVRRLTNTEVLGARFEERVLLDLGTLAGAEGRRGGLLSGLSGLGLVIETRFISNCALHKVHCTALMHSEL